MLLICLAFPSSYESITLLVFAISAIQFFKCFGREDSILEFISFAAIVQWLVAPYIAYKYFEGFSVMAVDSEVFFSIALPGSLMFILGLEIMKKKLVIEFEERIQQPKIFSSVLLIGIGISSFLLINFVPGALKNVFINAQYLTLIGLFYLVIGFEKYRKTSMLFLFGLLLMNAASTGMFGQLFLWSFFFFNLYFQKFKISLAKSVTMGVLAVILLMPVQLLKQEYRQKTWDDTDRKNDIGLLTKLYLSKLKNFENIFDQENLLHFNGRVNQGGIVSMTYAHVPSSQGFVKGSTIITAVKTSLIPRLFWKNKPRQGGAIMFPKFTGRQLMGKTSANISPLGEAYVNFGKNGSLLFMCLFGGFIAWVHGYSSALVKKKPLFIFWMPLLFTGCLLLGTDVNSILNAIVKSSFFIFLVYWMFRLVFRIEFY